MTATLRRFLVFTALGYLVAGLVGLAVTAWIVVALFTAGRWRVVLLASAVLGTALATAWPTPPHARYFNFPADRSVAHLVGQLLAVAVLVTSTLLERDRDEPGPATTPAPPAPSVRRALIGGAATAAIAAVTVSFVGGSLHPVFTALVAGGITIGWVIGARRRRVAPNG